MLQCCISLVMCFWDVQPGGSQGERSWWTKSWSWMPMFCLWHPRPGTFQAQEVFLEAKCLSVLRMLHVFHLTYHLEEGAVSYIPAAFASKAWCFRGRVGRPRLFCTKPWSWMGPWSTDLWSAEGYCWVWDATGMFFSHISVNMTFFMKSYEVIWNDMKLYESVSKSHEVTWNDMKWSRSLWFSLPRFSLIGCNLGVSFFCFFRSRTRSFGSGRVPTARTAAASSGGDANLSSWPARPRPWRPCWTMLDPAGLSFVDLRPSWHLRRSYEIMRYLMLE